MQDFSRREKKRFSHVMCTRNALQHMQRIASNWERVKKKETRIASWVLPSGSCTLYNTLQRPATPCNALQRPATPCNALQRTATHCNPTQRQRDLVIALKLTCIYISTYKNKNTYKRTPNLHKYKYQKVREKASRRPHPWQEARTYEYIYIYVHVRI